MPIPVVDRRTGRIVWAWQAPDVCPAGHCDGTVMAWRVCPGCRRADVAWRCRRAGCEAVAMDWEHDCDAPTVYGHGYPRPARRAY